VRTLGDPLESPRVLSIPLAKSVLKWGRASDRPAGNLIVEREFGRPSRVDRQIGEDARAPRRPPERLIVRV
jgi:hypothetical protein